jgi:predicted lactoylglutathione lyase
VTWSYNKFENLLNLNIMKPKKIWSNVAVSDLERTTIFYTELGFKPNGTPNKELTSFCVGEEDFVIHFFLREILKTGIKGEIANAQNANEVLFTLSAQSKAQVDDWAKEVEKAGGKLISKPETFGKEYYGFVFADPDGHRFNVFYMEGL